MKIVIATDHNGVEEKKKIIDVLKEKYEIIDMSKENYPTDNYPEFAFNVAEYVSKNDDTFGILLCGTGIGMSIAANKVKGIRCAHVSNVDEARLTRIDNNSNIISMSYKNDIELIINCINAFLTTEFSKEERHIRRVEMIKKYEEEHQL